MKYVAATATWIAFKKVLKKMAAKAISKVFIKVTVKKSGRIFSKFCIGNAKNYPLEEWA